MKNQVRFHSSLLTYSRINRWLCLITMLLLCMAGSTGYAQISLTNSSASASQNFDAMSNTTTLPANWRMAASTSSPSWAGGVTTVTQQSSSGSPGTGGTYNWGATASERAVGAMTSGSFASPNNLMAFFSNGGTSNITTLSISYKAERYRVNTAAASVQFFYSLNGTSWTAATAGDIAGSSFPTGTSSYTFASPLTVTVSGVSIPSLAIAPASSFYLRWNINTTGGNSQGIGIDDVSVTATFASGTAPVTFAITSISPASPTAGNSFNVTVESQDISNIPSNVVANTSFSLNNTGGGTIGGTTTGTITAGTSSVTVTGVTLSAAGTGVTLTAAQTAGDPLTDGISAAFTVQAAASQLAFTGVPAAGFTGINLLPFTVQARRPDNTVDNTFTGSISISKNSGPGTLSGTLTVNAVAGVATFSAAQFDLTGTYTLSATSGSLTAATTGNISITAPPIYWDFTIATPVTGVPANLTVSALAQGNNNGTTTLLSTTSGSNGYSGASGTNNAGAAVFTGVLNTATSTYFQVTLTPAAGYYFTLSAIGFGSRSTSTGPQAYSVFSSLDNYQTAVGTGTLSNNSIWAFLTNTGLNVSGATPVTFRIYGHNGSGSATAGSANWRIDDLQLTVSMNLCDVPILSAVVTDASCAGTTDGAIDLSLSGGTGPFTYSWNTGATTEDITAITSGTYSVTVTAAGGCTVQLNNIAVGATGTLVAYYQDADNDTYGNPAVTQSTCTGAPAGFVSNNTDCNDGNSSINPSAAEICDGVDDDCDGATDEGVLNTFYADSDNDGFGSAASTVQACTAPAGFVSSSNDCNDNNASINPGAAEICNGLDDNCNSQADEGVLITFYEDADNDGYGNTDITEQDCTAPAGFVALGGDCNDANPLLSPGVAEVCNGIDDDCDGTTDNGLTFLTYYADADGDGFGAGAGLSLCADPGLGYVLNNADCNDTPGINLNAPYNLSSLPGYGSVTSAVFYFSPGGWAGQSVPAGKVVLAASIISGGTIADFAVFRPAGPGESFPHYTYGANEYGWVMQAKSGQAVPGVQIQVFYADPLPFYSIQSSPGTLFYNGGGGYGGLSAPSGNVVSGGGYQFNNAYSSASISTLGVAGSVWPHATIGTNEQAWVVRGPFNGQSNPGRIYVVSFIPPVNPGSAINPNATEICNGVDDDCDGQIDEGVLSTFYADADNDGFGNAAGSVQACTAPSGYVTNSTDCNDNNHAINPNATEVCNDVDDDCDGQIDEGLLSTFYADADNDGFGNAASSVQACSAPSGYVTDNTDCNDNNAAINQNAAEICDGIDNDCDGLTDAADPSADNQAPMITCPANTTISCDASSLPASTGTATATDNSGSATVTYSDTPGQLIPSTFPGNTTVEGRIRWGNTGFEAALYDGPANLAPGAQLNPTGTPVWVLAEAYKFEYGYEAATGTQTLKIDFDNDNVFGAGETMSLTTPAVAGKGFGHFSIYMDGANSGNAALTLTNFMVNGNALGSYTTPGDGTALNLDWMNSDGYWQNLTATGSITFNGTTGFSMERPRIWFRFAGPTTIPAAPACPQNYVINRVWTATDACGNVSQCVQNITVQDITAPVITNAAGSLNQTASCTAQVPAANTALITANDNCSGTVNVTVSADVISAQTCANRYTVTRTYTATDLCGNASTFVQVITVNDQTGPVISNPAGSLNQTVNCAAFVPAPTAGLISATDNCGGTVTVTSSDVTNPGSNANNFTITRTYTATDVCGNASTFVQTITINDQIAPAAPTLVNDTLLWCDATPGAPTTMDNCAGTITGTTTTAFPLTTVGSTVVTWTFTDGNGNSSTANQTIVVLGPPTTGPISGTASQCIPVTAGTATYSVAAVPFVSSYVWSVPAGMTIISGQGTTSISVSWTTGAASTGMVGNVTVTPSNACGTGTTTTLSIALIPVAPVTPGSISGNSRACAGDVVTYSVAAVARAATYIWTLPTGMTLTSGAGTNVISVSVGAAYTGGTISVTASNACGSSPARTKALGLNLPLTPAAITGPASGVCGATSAVYTTTGSAAAASYLWAVPAGATIVSGQGTTTITVDFTGMLANIGSITVAAVNGCGNSLTRSYSITKLPARPVYSLAPTTVCVGVNETYTVNTVAGASSYNWTVPTGSTLISGAGTKTVVVSFSTAAINNPNRIINVSASNACGTGPIASTPVITVNNCARTAITTAFGEVNLYPNPTSERSLLTFNSADERDYTLRVMDLSGRVLMQENRTGVRGLNQADINVSGFAQGIYLVQLRTAGEETTIKLMVE